MAAEQLVIGNWGRRATQPAATPTAAPKLKAEPQESNVTYKAGTNLAGTSVSLPGGGTYTLKGASAGTPAPAQAPAASAPAVASSTPPQAGIAPEMTPTTAPPPSGAPGLNIDALRAAGLDDEAIQKVQNVLAPKLSALGTVAEDQKMGLDLQKKGLEEEQKMVEEGYSSMKSAQQELADMKQGLINESAQLQQSTLEQAKAKEEHLTAQAQARYEMERAREEQRIQDENMRNEQQVSRALASQLGVAFGSYGLTRITDIRQAGSRILADARAETSIGKAEFAFRLNDIERNYANEVNRIEQGRRDLQIQTLSDLTESLQAIDEKILLSAVEKKEQARELVAEYLKKKEDIDVQIGDLLSTATEQVYLETENLKEKKREEETFDSVMSGNLGFFANKWGEPINTLPDGTPRPFVGGYNEALSAQFGYLVNNAGEPIKDENGNTIRYKPNSSQLFDDALKSYYEGTATGYQTDLLNGKVGENNVIKTKVKDGTYGGQCGTFIRTNFTDEGPWETACAGLAGEAMNECSKNAKMQLVNSRGFRRGAGNPSVGDVVIFTGASYGKVGHYAMINSIDPVSGKMTLTESNLDLKGTVRTTRQVDLNDANVYGFFTPKHKEDVAMGQPVFTPPGEGGSEGGQGYGAGGRMQQALSRLDIQLNPAGYTMADAAKATEGEATEAKFAATLLDEELRMQAYEDAGIDTPSFNTAVSQVMSGESPLAKLLGINADVTPLLNDIKDPTERALARARLNWVKAKLRRESGAAISATEYMQENSGFFPSAGATEQEKNAALRGRGVVARGFISASRRAAPLIPTMLTDYDYSQDVVAGGTPTSFGSVQERAGGFLGDIQEGLGSIFDTLVKPQPNVPTAEKYNFYGTNLSSDATAAIDKLEGKYTEEEIKAFLQGEGLI